MALADDLQLSQSLTLMERHALLEEIYNQLAKFPIPPPIDLSDLPDTILFSSKFGTNEPAPLLPRFTGVKPDKWIAYANRYFDYYAVDGIDRFPYVTDYFSDEAALWFSSIRCQFHFKQWSDFTKLLMDRFSSPTLTPSALQVFDEMTNSFENAIDNEIDENIDDEVML